MRMSKTLRAVTALTLLALTAVPLAAVAPAAARAQGEAPLGGRPAPATEVDVAQIEAYLNGIRTLKSDFLQVSPAGDAVRGTFYLSRPGRMRIEYEAPIRNFIVADGRFVYFWDAELEQQSNAPIGSTLADFLLREDIRLSGDVTITDVRSDAGVLEVSLVQTKDPGLGQLTLVFEERPFSLRKWRVLDQTGQVTEVALLNPEQGVSLDRDLFFFRDPSRRRERE